MKLLRLFYISLFFSIVLVTSGCALRSAPGGEVRSGSGSTTWSKTYGSIKGDEMLETINVDNDGIILGGASSGFIRRSLGRSSENGFGYEDIYSFASGKIASSVWVQKLDYSGNKIWSKIFGDNSVCVSDILGLAIDSERNSVSVGTINLNDGSKDIGVMKTDPSGKVIWCRAYNGTRLDLATESDKIDDIGKGVAVLPNGTIVVTGSVEARVEEGGQFFSDTDVLVFGLNSDGEVLWQNEFGNRSASDHWDETPNSINLTRDGGVVIAATAKKEIHVTDLAVQSYGRRYDFNFFVIRLNADGGVRWTAPERQGGTYGFTYDERVGVAERTGAVEVIELANGMFAGVGPLGDNGLWTRYFTFDRDGGSFHTTDFEGIGQAIHLIQSPSPDSSVYVATSAGNILKLSINGDIVWQKNYRLGYFIDLLPGSTDYFIIFSRNSVSDIHREDIRTSDGSSIISADIPDTKDEIFFSQFISDRNGGWLSAGTWLNSLRHGVLIHFLPNNQKDWVRSSNDQYDMSATSISVLSDSGILVGGNSLKSGCLNVFGGIGCPSEAWIMRLSNTGDEQCDYKINNTTAHCWQKSVIWQKPMSILAVFGDNDAKTEYRFFSDTLYSRLDASSGNNYITKVFSGDKDFLKQVIKLSNDRYALLTSINKLIVINGLGEVLSQYSSNNVFNNAKALTVLPDDSIIIASEPVDSVLRVSKILNNNLNMSVAWSVDVNGLTPGSAISLATIQDGSVAVGANTNQYGGGTGSNFWLLKFNQDGQLVAQKTFGTGMDDRLKTIKTIQNGLVVAGETSGISGSADTWILRLDENLSVGYSCPNGLGTDSTAVAMTVNNPMLSLVQALQTVDQFELSTQFMKLVSVDFNTETTEQCSENSQRQEGRQPTTSAAPAVRSGSYTPGGRDSNTEPAYTPPARQVQPGVQTKASFTKDWNKQTGILRLDGSQSTAGYKYQWFFGWLSGQAQSPAATENPQMVLMVRENQLTGNNPSVRWVVLNLVDDSGKVLASERQILE